MNAVAKKDAPVPKVAASYQDDPAWIAVNTKLTPIVQRRLALAARRAENDAILSGTEPADHVARLEAQVQRSQLDLDLLKIEQEEAVARREEAAAREAARERLATSLTKERDDKVRANFARCRTLIESNREVQAIQQRLHEATGLPFESVCFFELEMRFESMLRAARAMGIEC